MHAVYYENLPVNEILSHESICYNVQINQQENV
jgi:hypothetical protein